MVKMRSEAGVEPRRRRSRAWAPLLAAAAVLLWSGTAPAVNPFHFGSGHGFVFQSGGPDNHPGVTDFGSHPFNHYTRLLPLGTTTLHLYATGGPADSLPGETVCKGGSSGGSGDEICGLDVEITITGPAHVSDFRAAGPPGGNGIRSFPMSGFGPGVTRLRLVAPRGLDPMPAGAHLVGELDVTVTGASGVVVSVTDGGLVLANRQTVSLAPVVLAVPEPGLPWLLGAAVSALALLHRLRRVRAA